MSQVLNQLQTCARFPRTLVNRLSAKPNVPTSESISEVEIFQLALTLTVLVRCPQ
jgi:hypothetical protein